MPPESTVQQSNTSSAPVTPQIAPAATPLPTPPATPQTVAAASQEGAGEVKKTVEAPAKSGEAPVSKPKEEEIVSGGKPVASGGEAPANAVNAAPAVGDPASVETPTDYKTRAAELEEKLRIIELEKDKFVQQERMRQLSNTEQEIVRNFQQDIAAEDALYRQMVAKEQRITAAIAEAQSNEDWETFAQLQNDLAETRQIGWTAYNRKQKQEQAAGQAVAQHRLTIDGEKKNQFERAVTAQLKEFDLELSEVLKEDPKALENPFNFNKATAKALTTKFALKEKALKEEAANAKKAARAEWEAEAPGSVVGIGEGGAGASSGQLRIGYGNSGAFLKRAFAKKGK